MTNTFSRNTGRTPGCDSESDRYTCRLVIVVSLIPKLMVIVGHSQTHGHCRTHSQTCACMVIVTNMQYKIHRILLLLGNIG